nr:S26 family signal peptidase [Azospirillum sp. OGB3]
MAALFAGGSYITDRYRIGIDPQISRCLPDTRVVLIDRWDQGVERGQLVAFAARGLTPYFKDGTTMVKVVDGVPGDHVAVGEASITVNGSEVGEGLALARTLGRPAGDFVRELVVSPGAVWVMGRTIDSYDSRYWGELPAAQIVGRAYRLF